MDDIRDTLAERLETQKLKLAGIVNHRRRIMGIDNHWREQEDQAKLVELHDHGFRLKDIAEELDTPLQTVNYWIHTLGLHVVKVLVNPHLEMIEVNNKGDHSEIIHRNNKGDDHA